MRCLPTLTVSGVCALTLACARGPVVDTQQVTVRLTTDALPSEDPAARSWSLAAEHPAALMVQDVTEPRLTTPGVGQIRVRALHNGDWIAFRLDWDDATQDLVPESGRASDAVAVQFPLVAGADVPDPAMGEQGRAVRIWYWKALWQDDLDRADRGAGDRIAALYPFGTSDHYPYEANPDARAELEKRYSPARAAGNPIAGPLKTPVQVLAAEGFGTTGPAGAQQAAGRGTWAGGRWTATVARPLTLGADGGALVPGERTYVAFAVWDGAAGHAGGRKMRSGWIPLLLEAR